MNANLNCKINLSKIIIELDGHSPMVIGQATVYPVGVEHTGHPPNLNFSFLLPSEAAKVLFKCFNDQIMLHLEENE